MGGGTRVFWGGLEGPKKICEGWRGFGVPVRVSGATLFFGGESQGDFEVFEWSRGAFCGSWGYFVGLGVGGGCPRGILEVPGGFWGRGGLGGGGGDPGGERGSRRSRPRPRPRTAHAPPRALPGPPPAHAPRSPSASRGAAAFAQCVLTPPRGGQSQLPLAVRADVTRGRYISRRWQSRPPDSASSRRRESILRPEPLPPPEPPPSPQPPPPPREGKRIVCPLSRTSSPSVRPFVRWGRGSARAPPQPRPVAQLLFRAWLRQPRGGGGGARA